MNQLWRDKNWRRKDCTQSSINSCTKLFLTSGCYTPMRNAVEPQNTESAAPYCPQRFSRKDPCECPIKKKHADLSKTFHCKECKKTFRYEMALHLHEEHCGNEKPKPFKCSDCGKCFTRRATLEHHQQHFHLWQQGSGLKRAVEEREGERGE